MNDTEHTSMRDLIRDPIEITSFILTYSGILLTNVHKSLIVVTALGLALPHILAGLGVIRRDEFHHEATMKALATAAIMMGVLAIGTIAFQGAGGTYQNEFAVNYDDIPASLVLLLGILSYQITFLVVYWGARLAASRIYLAYGVLLVAMSIVVLIHLATLGTTPVLKWAVSISLPTALLVLSWLCRHRPRIAGFLGLCLTAWLVYLSGLTNTRVTNDVPWDWLATLMIAFIGAPVLVPSVFLLVADHD